MKKLIATIAILLLGMGAASASSLDEIKSATHILHRDNNAICSGQFITPQMFVTAAHCVYGKNSIYTIKDSTVLHLEAVNKDKDVAVFSTVLNEDHSFVEFQLNPTLELGEVLYTVGYMQAKDFLISQGLYSGMMIPDGLSLREPGIVISTSGLGGMSGGGLYKMIDGELKLVGILSGANPIATVITPIFNVFGIVE